MIFKVGIVIDVLEVRMRKLGHRTGIITVLSGVHRFHWFASENKMEPKGLSLDLHSCFTHSKLVVVLWTSLENFEIKMFFFFKHE